MPYYWVLASRANSRILDSYPSGVKQAVQATTTLDRRNRRNPLNLLSAEHEEPPNP